MKPVTALIAEDEAAQREGLAALLREQWPELDIVATCEDGLSALEALDTHRPQVAFLDIRMPGASGIEVARAASGKVHVVFVTAYDEYAVSAFETGAADYLLKPVVPERLAKAVERLRSRLDSNAPTDLTRLLATLDAQLRSRAPTGLKWVTASIGDTVKMFPIDEVLFFQAQDKYVRVVTTGDEAIIRTPLKELVRQLDPEIFWQIHRSIIVRATAIDRVQKDALGHCHAKLKGSKEVLPVSAAYQSRFRSCEQGRDKQRDLDHDEAFVENMMRFLTISIVAAHMLASTGFALTDDTPHVSPCGKFMIVNIGDTATWEHHFELRRRSDSAVIFTFKERPGFDLPSFASNIIWSGRSEFVALKVSTAKEIRDTLVIATATGQAITILTSDPDYQTMPVRWTPRDELVVKTSATHGGKADEAHSWYFYRYCRTFRVRDGGGRVECVYTGPVVHPYRAQLLKEGYNPPRNTAAD
jgi:DNA-binding LytR/AlgR family response regulator